MLDASFKEILKMQLGAIKPAQALPVGTYLCLVQGQPKIEQAGQNNTPCVTFTLQVLQAVEVDQEKLAEVINGGALAERTITPPVLTGVWRTFLEEIP